MLLEYSPAYAASVAPAKIIPSPGAPAPEVREAAAFGLFHAGEKTKGAALLQLWVPKFAPSHTSGAPGKTSGSSSSQSPGRLPSVPVPA